MSRTKVQLVGDVNGGANFTGIVTATSANVGSGITLSGTQINVGSATTIHSSGFRIGSSDLHSSGLSIDNLNSSGIGTFNDINFTGTLNQNGSPFVASRWTAGTGDDIYRLNGNVGLGTTNPGAKLSVIGTVSIGETSTNIVGGSPVTLRVVNPDTSTYGGAIQNESYGSTNEPGFLSRRARGTISSPSQILLDDRFGFLIGSTYGTTSYANPIAINFYAEENHTDAARGSYIQFQTTNIGASVRTEKVRITANGNVGINSTNPSSTLSVGGTITELSQGQYWNVVTQADVGIGASQVPLNQYLGQLAFLDEYAPPALTGTIQAFSCERNGAGSVGGTMAFGNGAATIKGLRMPFAGQLIAATLHGTTITGTITVSAYINGVENTSYQLTGTVPSGTADVNDTEVFATPLNFSAGDTIGWYQNTVPSVSSGYVVSFYVKFVA